MEWGRPLVLTAGGRNRGVKVERRLILWRKDQLSWPWRTRSPLMFQEGKRSKASGGRRAGEASEGGTETRPCSSQRPPRRHGLDVRRERRERNKKRNLNMWCWEEKVYAAWLLNIEQSKHDRSQRFSLILTNIPGLRFAFHTPLPWAAERTSLFERCPCLLIEVSMETAKQGREKSEVCNARCAKRALHLDTARLWWKRSKNQFPSCWYRSDTNSHTDINLGIDIWIHQPTTICWALCTYLHLIVLNCTMSVDLLWFPCISQLFFLKRGGIIWA